MAEAATGAGRGDAAAARLAARRSLEAGRAAAAVCWADVVLARRDVRRRRRRGRRSRSVAVRRARRGKRPSADIAATGGASGRLLPLSLSPSPSLSLLSPSLSRSLSVNSSLPLSLAQSIAQSLSLSLLILPQESHRVLFLVSPLLLPCLDCWAVRVQAARHACLDASLTGAGLEGARGGL